MSKHDPAIDALNARLKEIQEQAAGGDPAFQTGSTFFKTRLGSAVESTIGGDTTTSAISDALSAVIAQINAASGASAASDTALAQLQADLQREALAEQTRQFDISAAEQKRQFGLSLAEQQAARAFSERDIVTQRTLEAAGLATGPTGAIQLAFLARGEGAPNKAIRSIFQKLPFLRALLAGKALPGFGLPEQLGATTARTSSARTTTGGTFGLTLPTGQSVTEQEFGGLSDFEKSFLDALNVAETGDQPGALLSRITESFIPTTGGFSF